MTLREIAEQTARADAMRPKLPIFRVVPQGGVDCPFICDVTPDGRVRFNVQACHKLSKEDVERFFNWLRPLVEPEDKQ